MFYYICVNHTGVEAVRGRLVHSSSYSDNASPMILSLNSNHTLMLNGHNC